MKFLINLLFIIILTGCGTTKTIYVDRIVEVPKIVFKELPKAANIIKPQLYIMKLNKQSDIDSYLNSCIISLEQSIGYYKKLEIAIKPFKE